MAETVNYVIQRGDLYCTLGCVAALLIYARYPSHWDEAIAAAQRAVALQPDFQLAKNNLAWAQSQKELGVR
jgi:hypothetical protein